MSTPLQKIVGGKYEIVHKIKEGGVGVIYKVRHRLLDEEMVIKVLRQQLAFDDEMLRRFQYEAKSAIRLHHPNIARIHDFSADPDEGVAFIVMEFIDGLSLEEMLKGNGPASLPLTIEIALQFLSALGYLHSHGIVHRDVAADNIMLSRDEEGEPLVRLIDLGIAKSETVASGLTSTGVYMGKFQYSSPEQFGSDSSKVERRSDLYSFGVLLYRLLTGCFPIRGDTFRSLATGHLLEEPVPFSEIDPEGLVPEELRRVVLHSLVKDPKDRIGSAGEFSRALAKSAGAGPHRSELDAIFTAVESRRAEVDSPTEPGSTQQRIDKHFRAEEDTAAAELERQDSIPTRRIRTSPVADPSREIGKVAWLVDRALQEARFDEAEEALEKALRRYGEVEVLVALRERLDSRQPGTPEPKPAEEASQPPLETVLLSPTPAPTPVETPRLEVEGRPAPEAVEGLSAQIEQLIGAGEYAEAETGLGEMLREYGQSERHAELQRRLAAERQRAAESRLRALRAEAQRHRAGGNLKAAAAALNRLLKNEPGDRDARDELRQVESDLARQVEEDRQAAIQGALAGIEEHLAARRLGKAKRELARVRRHHGDAPALTALSTRCRQLERADRENRSKLRRARLRGLMTRVPRTVWAALGISLLLASAIGLWLSLPDRPGSVTGPGERPPPLAGASGLLVLNALPWARITSVEGADGPRELPDEPFTPLALSLPPGEYTLTLVHPSAARPRTIEVQIGAGTTTSEMVDFANLDAEEYFRRLGW